MKCQKISGIPRQGSCATEYIPSKSIKENIFYTSTKKLQSDMENPKVSSLETSLDGQNTHLSKSSTPRNKLKKEINQTSPVEEISESNVKDKDYWDGLLICEKMEHELKEKTRNEIFGSILSSTLMPFPWWKFCGYVLDLFS